MKKTILTFICGSLFLGAFAQWNNTGDSKTTGNLSVGAESKIYSKIELISRKLVPDPGGDHSKISTATLNGGRDIIFRSEDGNGTAVLRSYTGGGWGGGFLFLSGTGTNAMKPRFGLHGWGQTHFYDKYINLGLDNATQPKLGEGTVLHFGGFDSGNQALPNIAAYAREANKADLRVSMGSAANRFMVGTTSWNNSIGANVFNPLFYIHPNGNVAIGTKDTFTPTYKLEVNGTIRAKEVRVETGWADFVFKDDYKLPTLKEVKAHIDEYKHLPGMPSEAEVKENGVGLADATTKLLQKVEELTLYAIQQQETIEKLTKEVDELKNTEK